MMASQDVFVGIDVSKDRLDVHVRPLGVGFSVGNEAAGYAGLIARKLPEIEAVHPNLTLEGLRLVANRNLRLRRGG